MTVQELINALEALCTKGYEDVEVGVELSDNGDQEGMAGLLAHVETGEVASERWVTLRGFHDVWHDRQQ